jgi:hypothetical protein
MNETITKNVVFEKKDYLIVKKFAEKKGLGIRGFSAALRMIIRAFDENDHIRITEAGLTALGETEKIEVIQPEI